MTATTEPTTESSVPDPAAAHASAASAASASASAAPTAPASADGPRRAASAVRYAPSPAGPVGDDVPLKLPPGALGSTFGQTMRFLSDPYGMALADQGRYGDVWGLKLFTRAETMLATSHPDHIRSVFTAAPGDAPSLTGESPLRPLMGPNSVLTLVGDKHIAQRKLLLPPFHGDAVARYVSMIEEVASAEIDTWREGDEFALAPRMQAVTLEVIMRGVLGIEEPGSWRTPQRRFREAIKFFLSQSTNPLYPFIELLNARRAEPRGPLKTMVQVIDRELYQFIRARRAEGEQPGRHDVFSMLLAARDEEGRPMSDEELRDEIVTLILAGHETTANSLAWTFERLVRWPAAYATLRDTVRGDDPAAAEAYVEATIHEGMRVRPVISFVIRMAKRPWRFGEYVVPAGTPLALSIVGVQHREDVYAGAHLFRPERFLDDDGRFVKPGTYTWIPFGGGIRRCLGATLAMAEQRVVLREIARRVDLAATDPAPERARQRNVTTIPAGGGRVRVVRKLA